MLRARRGLRYALPVLVPLVAGWGLTELFAHRLGWGVGPGAAAIGLLVGVTASFGPACWSWIKKKWSGTHADRDGVSRSVEAGSGDGRL